MSYLIKLEDLQKVYPAQKRKLFSKVVGVDKIAVESMSYEIEKGEMVAFLGPNGAGKTTTIKMMTGILEPSSGNISIMGMIPHKNRKAYAKHIGVVFGNKTQLWWDLPLQESFEFLKYIYKIPQPIYEKNMSIFTELLDLHHFMNRPVRELSLGQRMRGDIAAALLHDPEILFLDEPTIGLDVVAKKRIREFLVKINKEKKTTLLLTTHDMDDVTSICQRLILIDNGKKIYDGEISRFMENNRTHRILVVELLEKPERMTIPLGTEVIREEEDKVYIKFDPADISTSDLIAKLSAELKLKELSIQDVSIEEIIRSIYERPNQAQIASY